MSIEQWQLGLVVTFLLAHLLIAYGTYRLSGDRQPPAGARAELDRQRPTGNRESTTAVSSRVPSAGPRTNVGTGTIGPA